MNSTSRRRRLQQVKSNRAREAGDTQIRANEAALRKNGGFGWKVAIALSSLVILAASLWYPSIHFDFIYDDHLQIESNLGLRSWEGFLRSLHEPLWSQLGPERASPYYRPLFSTFLFVQYTAFGLNTQLWHMAAIGLHILVALVLFWMLLLHFRCLLSAWTGACFFACSPLAAEVVNWVSATNDSLCTLFFLLTLCGYLLSHLAQNVRRAFLTRLLAACFLAMAIFSKETAVVAIPLSLIFETVILGEQNSRFSLWSYSPTILPLMVYLVVHPFPHFAPGRPVISVISAMPFITVFAIRKLVWPVPVSEFYDLWLRQPHSAPSMAMHMGILTMLACTSVWLATRSRFTAWALLVIMMPLAVSIAGITFFRDYDLFHDRYLYWSLTGYAMLLAAAVAKVSKVRRWRGLAIALFVLVISVQVWASRSISNQFSNDIALYNHAVKVAPQNIVALQLLADTELHAQSCPAALAHLQEAQQLRPDLWQTNFYLGIGSLRCGQSAQAKTSFDESTKVPGAATEQEALSWYELGRLRLTHNDLPGAEAALRQAALRQPGSRKIQALLAETISRQKTREVVTKPGAG